MIIMVSTSSSSSSSSSSSLCLDSCSRFWNCHSSISFLRRSLSSAVRSGFAWKRKCAQNNYWPKFIFLNLINGSKISIDLELSVPGAPGSLCLGGQQYEAAVVSQPSHGHLVSRGQGTDCHWTLAPPYWWWCIAGLASQLSLAAVVAAAPWSRCQHLTVHHI